MLWTFYRLYSSIDFLFLEVLWCIWFVNTHAQILHLLLILILEFVSYVFSARDEIFVQRQEIVGLVSVTFHHHCLLKLLHIYRFGQMLGTTIHSDFLMLIVTFQFYVQSEAFQLTAFFFLLWLHKLNLVIFRLI